MATPSGGYEKIVLVTRQTRLEGLVERFNTREQARFYIEHSGGNFNYYLREHETYQAAVRQLQRRLPSLARLQTIERRFLPNFLFAPADLVMTIGVDGLVVNTAKYLRGQPLVAVNPDPMNIDGVLLPFTVQSGVEAARRMLKNTGEIIEVSMAQASLADGQTLLAFNDLFIGVRGHVSARYSLQSGQMQERQSSSGIIISTGVGATGWLSSMFNMVNGMLIRYGGVHERTGVLRPPQMAWGSDELVFVVREPFISKTSQARLVCGQVTNERPLVVESEMPENGIIFSDGVEADFLAFNAGAKVEVRLAEHKTNLVVA